MAEFDIDSISSGILPVAMPTDAGFSLTSGSQTSLIKILVWIFAAVLLIYLGYVSWRWYKKSAAMTAALLHGSTVNPADEVDIALVRRKPNDYLIEYEDAPYQTDLMDMDS
jgi:hypothetical protein